MLRKIKLIFPFLEEREGEISATNLDFDYAYGQIKHFEKTETDAYSLLQVEK